MFNTENCSIHTNNIFNELILKEIELLNNSFYSLANSLIFINYYNENSGVDTKGLSSKLSTLDDDKRTFSYSPTIFLDTNCFDFYDLGYDDNKPHVGYSVVFPFFRLLQDILKEDSIYSDIECILLKIDLNNINFITSVPSRVDSFYLSTIKGLKDLKPHNMLLNTFVEFFTSGNSGVYALQDYKNFKEVLKKFSLLDTNV